MHGASERAVADGPETEVAESAALQQIGFQHSFERALHGVITSPRPSDTALEVRSHGVGAPTLPVVGPGRLSRVFAGAHTTNSEVLAAAV